MKPLITKAIIASLAVATAAPALAGPPPWAPAHGRRARDWQRYDWNHPDPRVGYYDPSLYYDNRGYRPYRMGPDDRIYRGGDGRYYCRRKDGTTGLIVGGIAGGVLGNVIAPRGSKTLGSIAGGALGAIIGKSLDDGIVCR